ncbi:MAG: ABC transporter ATP-binding protein [Pseudomonadota bacterium]
MPLQTTHEGAPPAADPATHYITVDDLTCDYGGAALAVDRLSFTVERGEFVGLLGPSGCGKSTTLRMIAGLTPPTSGDIVVGGAPITDKPPWERNLGVVFQNYALFPHMSVAANVAFGLKLRNTTRREARERVEEALRVVRLEGLGERRPKELSGGQQQRVAIARAIVINPDILLLDEPLSNLDARLRDEMRVELRQIHERIGITTLFVTHDQHEALTMCDRIAVMNAGRLEQIGTPGEIYDQAASPFVARFIGRANSLACTTEGDRIICAGAPIPGSAAGHGRRRVTAMVRPHVIAISAEDDGVRGTVARRTFVGSIVEVEVALADGQTIVVEVRPQSEADRIAAKGASVTLTWDGAHTLVFAE